MPPATPEPCLLVAIATYNERENLATLVKEIHTFVPAADILIIDDNSPDGTGQLADALATADARVHVLHRAGKLGLGTAILASMRYAAEHGYDYLVTMDADFSHHPKYLPSLLAGMGKHDVMIGSRYVSGGGALNWPFWRRVISRGVNSFVRLVLRIPARDTSGGYRCYRVAKLHRTRLDLMMSRGYSFEEELLLRCHKAHLRIGETPIVFENRRQGASKVAVPEIIRSLFILVRLCYREMFTHRESYQDNGEQRSAPR